MKRAFTWDQDLRVLTLWQPWASLMAWGEKLNETRPENTTWRNHRGWIAIHAAQREPVALPGGWEGAEIASALGNAGGVRLDELPRSQILALVWFERSFQIPTRTRGRNESELLDRITLRERAFGDYTAGRWVFQTDPESRLVLMDPIDHRGGQGIPRAPEALKRQIDEQVNR